MRKGRYAENDDVSTRNGLARVFGYKRWLGFDLEKIAGAGFTGLSTKNGDLLTVNFRNCMHGSEAGSQPQRMFCALNYDAILNIKDSGIELLD